LGAFGAIAGSLARTGKPCHHFHSYKGMHAHLSSGKYVFLFVDKAGKPIGAENRQIDS
jgi:hypothetical protein